MPVFSKEQKATIDDIMWGSYGVMGFAVMYEFNPSYFGNKIDESIPWMQERFSRWDVLKAGKAIKEVL
jgi:hypothetical protein